MTRAGILVLSLCLPCCAGHHCQSALLWPHPLRREAGHSLSHVLHDALVPHKGAALCAVQHHGAVSLLWAQRRQGSQQKLRPSTTWLHLVALSWPASLRAMHHSVTLRCLLAVLHKSFKQSNIAALCFYEELQPKALSAVCLQYFPQPLARLNHVEDSRMIGIRNYLSYLAVDDFTWAGLGECMHRDRRITNYRSR